MTESIPPPATAAFQFSDDITPRAAESSAGNQPIRHPSEYVNIERRTQYNTVFVVEDEPSHSIMPRPSHWSVAWSDLMMTMFVLFLSMYVYQLANQEFLAKKKPEVIGGDTTEALQILNSSKATLPFSPIHPGLPLITAGTLKKIEKTTEDIEPKGLPLDKTSDGSKKPSLNEETADKTIPDVHLHPETVAVTIEAEQEIPPPLPVPPVPLPDEEIFGPNPIVPQQTSFEQKDRFQEIYRLSKGALESNNLDKFAAIDLVPDKTMRIILTGDLLFDPGESELSHTSMRSLGKVAAAIRHTPYMINVVGHTDNVPMHSSRFKSNWELSVARASSVARYLIEEAQMSPTQFVVSGYSSYRPVEPNTTADNRAKNRRVEIIISRRLPDPLPATAENLR